MKYTLSLIQRKFLSAASLVALPALSLLPTISLNATTLYWGKANPVSPLTWANSNNANWSSFEDSGPYNNVWVSGSDAVIITPDASIAFGGSYVNAASLTVRDGAVFTRTANDGDKGLRISGATGSSGSGDFSMTENPDATTGSLRIFLQSHVAGSTGYNGTITVNGFSTASSGLYLGAGSKSDVVDNAAYTGTDTNTHIVLNGGALFLNGGLAGNTATIGSLSGSGRITLGSIFSSNSGTRTLRIDQAANTVFTGTIGARTTDQTNNVQALTKAGAGSLTIDASGNDESGYAGKTTVEQGTLRLVGTFGGDETSQINQGDVVVQAGATLGLDGTLNFGANKTLTIEDGATLDAGRITINAAGTTASVGIAFGQNVDVRFTLGSGETGSSISLLVGSMKGSASGGDGSILFSFANAGDATVGETYDLIQFGGKADTSIVASTYALSQESIDAGWQGTFNYSGDGRTLQFTVDAIPSAIPEPATATLLLALGVSVFMFFRRSGTRS